MVMLLRALGAFVIVFGTYNPAGYSFVHWAFINATDKLIALKVLVGITLFIGWAFYFYSTKRALGWFGTSLAAIFFGVIFWLLIDWKIIEANVNTITWIVEIVLALTLWIGVSGALIRRRLSGQYSVDDVNE